MIPKFLLLAAAIPVDTGVDPAWRDWLIVAGVLMVLTGALLVWATFIRKKPARRKRRHHHHHHHRHSESGNASAQTVSASHREGRSRRRRRRREHRPRNPTLAETGGLPPIRSEAAQGSDDSLKPTL